MTLFVPTIPKDPMASRAGSSASTLHNSFSLFGVLMTKGEKRVISISVFHSSVVCNIDKNLLNAWLVIL
jgi:hypothetical protein